MKQSAASTGVFTLKIVQYNNTKTILHPHYSPKTTPKNNMADGCYYNTAHALWPADINDDEIITFASSNE